MMPVNHVHATVLANVGSLPRSESNRMLTAVDLTATGVIVNKQFLNFTYSPFKCIYPRVNISPKLYTVTIYLQLIAV